MRMRFIFFLFLPSFVSTPIMAQINHRNLLQKNYPSSQLQQLLVRQADFHPFPKTPLAWQQKLPDSVIQYLIRNGENALKQDFPNIPATVTLDFFRNGNRTRYENISFHKRNLLWNLSMAETVEGKK